MQLAALKVNMRFISNVASLASSTLILFASSLALSSTTTFAEEVSAPLLTIGSQAPALTGVTWLKGEPIDEFRKGKVYVLDFWAIWCGPCIQAMPHLSELREKFKDRDLTVVAITTADDSNPAASIKNFVEARSADLSIDFAMCESDAMNQAYMVAANQQAIPCSFVIDQTGNLAYIGLPGDLDIVLEKLYNGTWKGQRSIVELKAIESRIAKLTELLESDAEKALAELAAIEKQHPHVVTMRQYILVKLSGLVQVGTEDELKTYFSDLVLRLEKSKDAMQLATIGGLVISPDLNPRQIMTAEAEAAIEKSLAIDPADVNNKVIAAFAYATGRKLDKANALMDRAITESKTDIEKAQLQQLKAVLAILPQAPNPK